MQTFDKSQRRHPIGRSWPPGGIPHGFLLLVEPVPQCRSVIAMYLSHCKGSTQGGRDILYQTAVIGAGTGGAIIAASRCAKVGTH